MIETSVGKTDEWLAMCFATTIEPNIDTIKWWLNFCSTVHITHSIADLCDAVLWTQVVKTGGGYVYSTHYRTISTKDQLFDNILLVPNFLKRLLSASQFTKQGWCIIIYENNRGLAKWNADIKLV